MLSKSPKIDNRAARAGVVLLAVALLVLFLDMIWGQLPGPFHRTQTDVVFSFEPYKLATLTAFRQGEAFWWSAHASLGSPLVLPLGLGIFHPFHAFNLVMEAPWAYAIGLLSRLFLFAAFSYLYLLRVGVRAWLAWTLALGLALGNWNVVYAQQIVGYTLCFFPMALFFLDKLCEQWQWRQALGLWLALTGMLLGAFPSVLLYAWLVLVVYALWMARPGVSWLRLALVFALAVLACSPLLWETHQFFSSVVIDPANRAGKFNKTPDPQAWLTWVYPSHTGGFVDHHQTYGRDEFHGTKLGAGPLLLPLFLIALATPQAWRQSLFRRQLAFWLLLVLVCAVAYSNLFNVKALIQHLPVLKDHPLQRLQAFVAIGSCMALGIWTEAALRARSLRSTWHGLVLVLVVVNALNVWWWLNYGTPHMRPFAYLLPVLTLACVAYVYFQSWWTALSVLAVSMWSLHLSNAIHVERYTTEQFYPVTPVIAHLQQVTQPVGGRVLDVRDGVLQWRHAAYGLSSLSGHYFSDPPVRDMVQSLGLNEGWKGLTYSQVTDFDPVNAWPLLRELHAQFVLLPKHFERGEWIRADQKDYRVDMETPDFWVLRVLDQGRPTGEGDGFQGNGYRAFTQRHGQIRLVATKAGEPITLPVRMYPGWCIVDGDAHMLAPDELHRIRLEAIQPETMVELRFSPAWLRRLGGHWETLRCG